MDQIAEPRLCQIEVCGVELKFLANSLHAGKRNCHGTRELNKIKICCIMVIFVYLHLC